MNNSNPENSWRPINTKETPLDLTGAMRNPMNIEATIVPEGADVQDPCMQPLQVRGRVLQAILSNGYVTIPVGQWPHPDNHMGHRVEQKNPGGIMMTYVTVPKSVLYELGLDCSDPTERFLVSLVLETRLNLSQAGKVLCAPGGFAKPLEASDDAARREMLTETGAHDIVEAETIVSPRSHEFVGNRLFDSLMDGGRGNKVHIPQLQVLFSQLTRTAVDENSIACCDSEIPIWKHKNLKGRKNEEVFFVLPRDIVEATPDPFAHTAAHAVMQYAKSSSKLELPEGW